MKQTFLSHFYTGQWITEPHQCGGRCSSWSDTRWKWPSGSEDYWPFLFKPGNSALSLIFLFKIGFFLLLFWVYWWLYISSHSWLNERFKRSFRRWGGNSQKPHLLGLQYHGENDSPRRMVMEKRVGHETCPSLEFISPTLAPRPPPGISKIINFFSQHENMAMTTSLPFTTVVW